MWHAFAFDDPGNWCAFLRAHFHLTPHRSSAPIDASASGYHMTQHSLRTHTQINVSKLLSGEHRLWGTLTNSPPGQFSDSHRLWDLFYSKEDQGIRKWNGRSHMVREWGGVPMWTHNDGLAPGPIVNQDRVSPLRDANRGRQKPGATIPGCEKSCCAGASGCCKSGCVDVFGGSHGYWLPSPNKWEKCLPQIYSIRINANDFFMNEQHTCKNFFFIFFFKEACPSLIS